MAHDVFVSYSSRDQATALAVVNGLEAAGIRCWMAPRDIKAGDVWAQAIVEAIAGARALVLVFSSHANRSGHVVNEVDSAIRRGAIVVPFRIENVMPEGAMEYHLRTRHWLDALTPDLQRHIGDLVTTVQGLLGRPAAAPPQTEFGRLPEPKAASKSRPVIESTETAFHVKLPKTPGFRRTGKAALIGLGLTAALVFGYIRYGTLRPVSGTEFEVREVTAGSEFRSTVTATGIRFFESSRTIPPFNQRTYTTRFLATTARYVNTEVMLHLEAPRRYLSIPVGCTIYNGSGGVTGTFTLGFRVAPDGTDWQTASGWGADRPGSWAPGDYRVDCRYGDRLIVRGHFEILS